MKITKRTTFLFLVFAASFGCNEQVDKKLNPNTPEIVQEPENAEQQALVQTILTKDSLLFEIGFNQIDTQQVAVLVAEDFEFYHDEHGITDSKEAFLNNILGIEALPFKTWRTLEKQRTEIFPLYKNNSQELYGAIQNGIHNFYQQKEGEAARKTNIAKFTHLWILENEDWKLKRVLSYDHQVPK